MARQERLAAWPVTAELAVTNSGERNNAEGPPHTGAANNVGSSLWTAPRLSLLLIPWPIWDALHPDLYHRRSAGQLKLEYFTTV